VLFALQKLVMVQAIGPLATIDLLPLTLLQRYILLKDAAALRVIHQELSYREFGSRF
jgi:hypothetical protein